MESIVTGQLYIELSYRHRPGAARARGPAHRLAGDPDHAVAAGGPGHRAGSMVADVLRILFQVNEMLEDVDMPEINAAVVASAEAVERLVDSPEIRAALDRSRG
jgi:hypothetical protein